MSSSLSRRAFLARAGALGALGATPFALDLAGFGSAAQAAGGYKALVCIFLYGGNDAYNMLLATDAPSWRLYTAQRSAAPESIALLEPGAPANASAAAASPARLGGALPISPANAQGRSFALHPCMGQTQRLFEAKKIAFVANCGPLIQPLDKSSYANPSTPKPPKLFSHNDQQSFWQSFSTEGASVGWAGRMGDLLASGNGGSSFTCVSASGAAVLLAGRSIIPYQIGPAGALRIGGTGSTAIFGSARAYANMQTIFSKAQSQNALERDIAATGARSIQAEAILSGALPPASSAPFGSAANPDPVLHYVSPISGARTLNPLAQQLQVIARMISAGPRLGLSRQVFFASLSSFDSHDAQNKTQADLLARLDHALAYFDNALSALGLANQVTTFTMSDFGRTFASNGDGTDHGWGSHHLVMGGAVNGGDIYGAFPVYGSSDGKSSFTSPDQIQNGALLPKISTDQYAATLGAWFGVSAGDLGSICPNLRNFSAKNLGFLRA